MILDEWLASPLAGLALLLLFIGVLILAYRQRTSGSVASTAQSELRNIEAFTQIQRAVEMSVEGGQRIHYALGTGGLYDIAGAAGLAGLAGLYPVSSRTILADRPVITSAGDGSLGLLSEQVQKKACSMSGGLEYYTPANAVVPGLTPFSYAAGAAIDAVESFTATNVLLGNFNSEAVLISDSGARSGAKNIGGSSSLAGQAVLLATCESSLLGEDLFAASTYLGMVNSAATGQPGAAEHWQKASLQAQDGLRWIIIAIIIVGLVIELYRGL